MKRLKRFGIIALVLIAGIAIWILGFRTKSEPVVLSAEKPAYGHIAETVTATGTLEPVDTVAVGSQVSGTIKNIYADFNSVVKKGQLLAELDPAIMEATVSQIQAGVSEAQSAAAFQKNNFNRQNQLYQVGAISKADYDAAVNQYNAANAQVRSAQAQLQSAQRNLSYTKIYSPIDGVVLSRSINTGQTVAASFSTPTLFTIAKDITRMQVQAKVDEADIGNVKQGQRASFTVDAFLNDEFSGQVDEIRLSPTVSSNVVTYTTLISASNEEQKLKPGMTATITIFTNEDNHALLIPAKATQFSPDSSMAREYQIEPLAKKDRKSSMQDSVSTTATVWVKEGNVLKQKEIRIGLDDKTHVQVLQGLSADEEVVTGSNSGKVSSTSKTAAAPSSPFMPKRPSGSGRKQ